MTADVPGAGRPRPGATVWLDPASRLHLRIFAVHLGIIGLCSLPAVIATASRPDLLSAHLERVFSVAAVSVAVPAVLSGQGMRPASLGWWDEVMALLGLSAACSLLSGLLA